ncbi:MAG TPA: hypothetical protein VI670_13455 [Thermoanaerobaculia bacterium]
MARYIKNVRKQSMSMGPTEDRGAALWVGYELDGVDGDFVPPRADPRRRRGGGAPRREDVREDRLGDAELKRPDDAQVAIVVAHQLHRPAGAERAYSIVLRNDAAVPLKPSYRERFEQLLASSS